jgi:hypothetical protein
MFQVIKATSILRDPEQLRTSTDSLGEMLISVFNTLKYERDIENIRRKEQGLPEIDTTRIEGLISSYLNGLSNEFHSLAVKVDMIMYVIDKSRQGDIPQKDSLYLLNLLESYITSLRVIFDYVSVVYRIVIEEKSLPQIPSSDSFNDALKFIKKDAAQTVIPKQVIDVFLQYENVFENIKTIRDLIIHKGKEPVIYKDDKEYFFAVHVGSFPQSNVAKDILGTGKEIYPLIPYLSKLTNQVLDFTSDLGLAIYECLTIRRGEEIAINYSALEGICIPGFIKFLGITNEKLLLSE